MGKHSAPGCLSLIAKASAVAIIASGLTYGGMQLAQASGPDIVIVCFANQNLTAVHGDLQGPNSNGVWHLEHPDYVQPPNTDGHGLIVESGGFNQHTNGC